MEHQANQLASVLIEQGVQIGDRVGVFLKPSLETAIAIYGIMSAGAAYVPLDTSSPPSRIAYVIKDCGINHLISNSSQKDSLQKVLQENVAIKNVIGVDNDLSVQTISWNKVFQTSAQKVDIQLRDNALAYIMYTSGTTGVPKGIMHTHYSGLSYAKLSKQLYKISPEDRLGNHSPLHFDISTMGYFTIPLAGATTTIVPESYTFFPASLSQLIEKEKLTIWYSVPLALIQMLQRGALNKRNLSSLRWILFGGEPFPTKHLRELMNLLPETICSNVYGPAEVNQCTFYNMSKPPELDSPIPLGKAWDDTKLIIVDENDCEISNGEIGELLVQTPTLMKGYWSQSKLTKKSLYKKETALGFKEVFYRTGDLVKEISNGDLMFMGRKDRQIKLRGYRVELNEIEVILTTHKHVDEAAAYTFRNETDEIQIAATIVLKTGFDVEERSLLEHIKQHLPPYVVLDKILFSQNLPRTSAGKINHKKLEKLINERC